MEQVLQALFNTSHEAPSLTVLAVLLAVALVVPPLTQSLARKRSGNDKKGKK